MVKNQTLSALSSQRWDWQGLVAPGPGLSPEVRVRDSTIGWLAFVDLSDEGDKK